MIYKFESGENTLEVFQGNERGYSNTDTFTLIVEDGYGNGNQTEINLDKEALYNLIGALHSIQTKIKNI
tara:strand:- start:144 stop:350 length:207 start_codon:yes stop_codon:yes gene_type:complete